MTWRGVVRGVGAALLGNVLLRQMGLEMGRCAVCRSWGLYPICWWWKKKRRRCGAPRVPWEPATCLLAVNDR